MKLGSLFSALPVVTLLLAGCGSAPKPTPPPPAPPADPLAGVATPPPVLPYSELDRRSFNKLAARLNLPLYWVRDSNSNGAVDAGEVASLEFFPTVGAWVHDGKLTPDFEKAYKSMLELSAAATPVDPRLQKVAAELDQAESVLVSSDVSKRPEDHRKFVATMMEAIKLLDELYAVQTGADKSRATVATDPASQSLFRRNWDVRCLTPTFEKDSQCTASTQNHKQLVDVYPASLQADPKFCEKLEKDPRSKELLTPFSVVREQGGKLVAVPYPEAYRPQMTAIAAKLRQAEKDLTDPKETPMRTYLAATAKAFETNDWPSADEAWSKMNARNSSFYLRIGPDETYWEPCSQKAGFHASFALINTESLALQDKLTPHQQWMEDDLAKTVGGPYKARKVTFHLPDFIDLLVNAGDSRDPIGGTIGQSLPNWGAVANEGRGRTVAMTNLYTDPDSMGVRKAKAASLLSAKTMAFFGDQPGPGLLGTVLHEAAHNLGPSHEYKVNGKKDDQVFGGDLSSMLEELKAQSGAYYFLVTLEQKQVFDKQTVERTLVDNIVWSLNHVSRGMYTASGKRKAYSQLAAIHVGFFMEQGAVVWDPTEKAANGTDVGAFSIDFDKLRASSIELMKLTGGIKARGDKKGALELATKHVDEGTKVPMKLIADRLLRFPQPNFVYELKR